METTKGGVAISRQTISRQINRQPSMTIARRVNLIDCRSFRAGKGKREEKGRRWERCFDGGSSLTDRRLVTFNLFFTFCGGTNRREKRTVCFFGGGRNKDCRTQCSPPVRIVFPRNQIQGFLSKRDRSITSVPPLPRRYHIAHSNQPGDYAINPTKNRNINRKNEKREKDKEGERTRLK